VIISDNYKEDTQTTDPEFPYHAVKGVDSEVLLRHHEITVTSFNSVKTIDSDCDYNTVLEYGPDYQRNMMKVYYEGKIDYHKYYLSDYEYVEEADGDYKEISYIQTPTGIVASVINEKKNGVVEDEKLYYIHADYLGSVEALTDKDGNLEARFSYGTWGNLRDPDNWDEEISFLNKKDFLILERGYTGHEHLREYDLINMNGRIYDQLLGQFIQPDNNISQPESSQGYNRYSYVLNNPLKHLETPRSEFQGFYRAEAKISMELELPEVRETYLHYDSQRVPGKNGTEGTLSIKTKMTFGDDRTVATYDAVSGNTELLPIPNGDDWQVDNFRWRTVSTRETNPHNGFIKDGMEFTYDITPDPNHGRTALRIHPDGGNVGTAGCIGLSGSAVNFRDFNNRIRDYLSRYDYMRLKATGSYNGVNRGW